MSNQYLRTFVQLCGMGVVLIDPSTVVGLLALPGAATRIDLASGHSYEVAGEIDEIQTRLAIPTDRDTYQ